jgi:hypothetical protein
MRNSSDLRHYGIMGMRWGFRKDLRTTYEDSATRNEELAKADHATAQGHFKNASEIQRRPWKDKRLGDGHRVRNQKLEGYKKTNTAYAREAKARRMKVIAKALGSDKFDNRAVRPERERFDRSAERSYDKPYRPSDSDRNKKTYNESLKKLGFAVVTAIAVELVRPTAKDYGGKIAARIAQAAIKS